MAERNFDSLRKTGRYLTISALGAIGAWYIGANSYIGIKDEEYRQVAIGTGIGTVFEAGAGALMLSGKFKELLQAKTHDPQAEGLVSEEGKLPPGFYELTFQENPRLGEQEIELQDGKCVSLQITELHQ